MCGTHEYTGYLILDADKYNMRRNSSVFLLAGELQLVASLPPYVSGNVAGNAAGNGTAGRTVGQYNGP